MAEPARPTPQRPAPSSPFAGTLDLSRQAPFALAPPPAGGAPRQRMPPGSLDLSMGRVPQQQRRTPMRQDTNGNLSHEGGAEPSGSWSGAFMAWVRAHSFYPPQAAMNGEDGTNSVRMVIDRSGRVRSVELRRRSGSRWLDLGIQSIFRDQQVPAFTPDMEGDTMTITFTVNYILVYR
ncbi:TonB family protein [Roseomonas marmotae]|uniref:energy transducer TonB n=1 Tax=Roseomonas marmotae TaxID=2768161 RepID=UPI001AD686D0|nr:energy transducer TonB [Roseomonas marmotae]QTI80056.1 TonB family protein [Roseomonas marmotae]